MLERCNRAALFCLALWFTLALAAQATAQGVPHNADQPASDKYTWNSGLDITALHTSNTGWATLATASVGFRVNDTFSVDAALPIYFYRLAESRSARLRPDALLVNQRGEVGDLILSGHAQFLPSFAEYQLTGAIAAPSGDEAYGLTTGRVTFDLSNQFERNFGRFTPTLEIGCGDSSTLVNRLVTKTYTSLGPLAHFQAGILSALRRSDSLELDAYEQLPLGDQKIYTSRVSKKKTTTVVTGQQVSEDNGFNAGFEHTIDRHTTFTTTTAAACVFAPIRSPWGSPIFCAPPLPPKKPL